MCLKWQNKLSRPLVICLAIGSSLEDTRLFGATSTYIQYLSQRSHIAFSVSAGNEGNSKRHYYESALSSTSKFELRVSEEDPDFCFQIWPDLEARLSIQITSPTGERTPVIFPTLSNCDYYNFIFGNEKTWVNNILIEEENGSQMILVRFNPGNKRDMDCKY